MGTWIYADSSTQWRADAFFGNTKRFAASVDDWGPYDGAAFGDAHIIMSTCPATSCDFALVGLQFDCTLDAFVRLSGAIGNGIARGMVASGAGYSQRSYYVQDSALYTLEGANLPPFFYGPSNWLESDSS